MILPFTEGLIVTNGFDAECSMLADRHYSRRTIGARQFMYSGRKCVLRDAAGDVLFGWLWPDEAMRMDGQLGYNCTIFRNESARKSSEIILEAEQLAFEKWGPNRVYTYVNPHKLKPADHKYRRYLPGYCFLKAGWQYAYRESGELHTTKDGKILLFKEYRVG